MIARNSLAACIRALTVPISGIVDPLVVETMGLLEGMKWAHNKHWNRVCFETDCAVLVTALNGSLAPFQNEVGGIIQQCLALGSSFESIQFVHVRRSNNVVADAITRWATNASESCEWNEELSDFF